MVNYCLRGFEEELTKEAFFLTRILGPWVSKTAPAVRSRKKEIDFLSKHASFLSTAREAARRIILRKPPKVVRRKQPLSPELASESREISGIFDHVADDPDGWHRTNRVTVK